MMPDSTPKPCLNPFSSAEDCMISGYTTLCKMAKAAQNKQAQENLLEDYLLDKGVGYLQRISQRYKDVNEQSLGFLLHLKCQKATIDFYRGLDQNLRSTLPEPDFMRTRAPEVYSKLALEEFYMLIKELPKDTQRNVKLLLESAQGYKGDDLAKKHRMNANTMRLRIHYARKELKKHDIRTRLL